MKQPDGGRGDDNRRDAFEKTQEYLGRLLAYLEGLYTSMDWEAGENAPSPDKVTHGLPPRLARILSDSGYLQGLSLKAQGSLSSDIQEFIRSVGFAFEVEVQPMGVFKLPFIHNELSIQRKTMNTFMEKAWMVYHASLLSAYSLKPLRFEKLASVPGSDLEETVRIEETAPGEDAVLAGPASENAHALNNALTGIISYASLILAERPADADLQQKLGVVLEAARKAGTVLRKK